MNDISWWEKLKIVLQHVVPQHLLSACMYKLARCGWRPLKNLLIRFVIYRFDVDMTIALQPDCRAYHSFNDFFTRELQAEARPINAGDDLVICPVDGTISQIGTIDDREIFQAKGRTYNLAGLLSGDQELAEKFRHGNFATLYLSPRDYHRVHMPLAGSLWKMLYVPGSLFSVNDATTGSVRDLFARNERVISVFQTRAGVMAVILVGAIFVGSMETVWAGQITPAAKRLPVQWSYPGSKGEVRLEKGAELGRFNMGSTVILLFQPGTCNWLPDLSARSKVVMGQAIGKRLATSN